ncbi:hypothetical protein H2199_008437 [Coniosporium tulheliwenetii]|uniref:Uncharacterized protein n=1 Tax=Coniosporium tulheliwenetii TaxID=3383036 RepID=A0ACC2YJA6_9PEZI|nr:hypothetical protein H2199_008437 [Cladosporium sp. JES 115]
MKTLLRWSAHLLPLDESWGGQLDAASVKAIVDSPDGLLAPLELKRGARYWTAIGHLFSRPWWHRGWILQESTVSVPRYLYCGNYSVELNALCFVLHVATVMRDPVTYAWPWAIQQYSTRRQEGSCSTLLEVLGELRVYDCTDSRDKVYAGLGLIAGDISQDIIPDYTKPAEEVYMDVVKTILNRYPEEHKLDFLAYAVHPPKKLMKFTSSLSTKQHVVPSWLPDWSEHVLDHAFPKSSSPNGLAAGSKLYNAAGTHPTQACLLGNQLRVLGLFVGFVSQTSSPCCQYPFTRMDVLRFVKMWEPKDSGQDYKAGGTVQQAFLSTVVADVEHTTETIPRRKFAYSIHFSSLTEDEINAMPKESSIAFSFAVDSVSLTVWGRRLFWTTDGYMGIGSAAMKDGDKICMLFGGQVLYILRDIGNGHHEFIGECYVHGLMDGEALRGFEAGEVKSETLVIV